MSDELRDQIVKRVRQLYDDSCARFAADAAMTEVQPVIDRAEQVATEAMAALASLLAEAHQPVDPPDDLDAFITEQAADPAAAAALVSVALRKTREAATEAMAETERLVEAHYAAERSQRARAIEAEQRADRAEAAIANVRTYCEGVQSYCSANRVDPPPWVEAVLDSIDCLAALGQPPAEERKEDPKTRRELLRELTQEAVGAGSYAEPIPPDPGPDPYGEPDTTTLPIRGDQL